MLFGEYLGRISCKCFSQVRTCPDYCELISMGIRVNAETLKQQLEVTGQLDFLKFPYHKAIINDEIPLSSVAGSGSPVPSCFS